MFIIYDMINILEQANSISKQFSILSNIYRILIILYLKENKQSNWSEIKDYIESNCGKLNPNTLHFHLKALLESKFIKRIPIGDKFLYELDFLPTDILQAIERLSINKNK